MAKSFKWLPYVDNCCHCLYDLRSAVLWICVYASFCAFAAAKHILDPICNNFHGPTGFGLFIYIIEGICCLAGIIAFLATIVMGFTTVLNNSPIIKPYVLSTFFMTIVDLLLSILYFTKLATDNFKCEVKAHQFIAINKRPVAVILNIFMAILTGTFLLYYNIVANSYAMQWDEYEGRIPLRPDNVPVQPLPHRGQPWQPYNYQ